MGAQILGCGRRPGLVVMWGNPLWYSIEVSKVPYLASFASFQHSAKSQSKILTHGPIPLFDTALKGIESGYRQCFRLLPADLSQHHTLCETYDFLQVDVLGGQPLDEIINDLKSRKTDYELEYKRCIEIKGNKTKARDSAFKFLYFLLMCDFENESKVGNKVYNAVLFIVSHSGTFKTRARKIVRAAFEERFEISRKQRTRLDKWEKDEASINSEDDATTEEGVPDHYYCFDDSW